MNLLYKVTCLSLALLGATPLAQAEDSLTANVNLVSNYRFRGIDQTWGRPGLQGGADWAAASGLYAGIWASNVSGHSYPGGSLEIDLYAGYNGKWGEDGTFTAGVLGYVYPGANYSKAACPSAAFPACPVPSQRLDTLELNLGFGWKWLNYKLSVSTGDYFGANERTGYTGGTRGTLYHDLSASLPVGAGVTLALHLGRTDVKARYGIVNPDYTDYRVAVSKGFDGGWSLSAALAGADNDRFFRPPVGGLSAANGDTRELNKPTLVLQAGRSF